VSAPAEGPDRKRAPGSAAVLREGERVAPLAVTVVDGLDHNVKGALHAHSNLADHDRAAHRRARRAPHHRRAKADVDYRLAYALALLKAPGRKPRQTLFRRDFAVQLDVAARQLSNHHCCSTDGRESGEVSKIVSSEWPITVTADGRPIGSVILTLPSQ
jgi:hypothetical protein